MQVPELTDDAVVELAREGGVAFIPKLSGQRTIALSSLNEAQRQRQIAQHTHRQIEAVEQPQNIQSLEDIAAYKDKLRKQIEHEEECIAGKWNELFHKEEPAPQGKAQR